MHGIDLGHAKTFAIWLGVARSMGTHRFYALHAGKPSQLTPQEAAKP